MKEIAHAKRKHASFAPSSAERWWECEGSVELCKKAPPQKDNVYSIEGTNAHECLEFVVRRRSNLTAAALQAAKNKKWNAEMIEHAVHCAKVIESLRPSPHAKLLIETRSRLSNEVYGSLDYAWVEDWGRLIVIDYKYGMGLVLPIDDEGNENKQLMCYAGGIAKRFNYEFDSVELAIIQPRVWKDDEDPLTIGKTTIKRLREFERQAAIKVARAKQPGAKLKAGEHCKWCPASSFCPEISARQLDKAGIVFDVEEGITKLPKLEALRPKSLAVVLSACKALEIWIASVKTRAQTMAEDGEKIPGYKLVQKKSVRSWLPTAERALVREFQHPYEPGKLLSPAKLEKQYGKRAKKYTERFTSNISSGYTLVKESDSRSEITSTVAFDVD